MKPLQIWGGLLVINNNNFLIRYVYTSNLKLISSRYEIWHLNLRKDTSYLIKIPVLDYIKHVLKGYSVKLCFNIFFVVNCLEKCKRVKNGSVRVPKNSTQLIL